VGSGTVCLLSEPSAAPNTQAEIIGKLEKDDQITLVGRSEDGKWYQAQIAGASEQGWVFRKTLAIVSSDPAILPVVETANP
jgi:hypothetical protein